MQSLRIFANEPESVRWQVVAACWLLSIVVVSTQVPASSGDWIKLTSGQYLSDVQDYALSPDLNFAVFTYDPTVDDAFELFSVPVTGGEPIQLSGLLPSGSRARDFLVTPDSSQVIYIAPQNTGGVDELFSVSIDGGIPVRLNDDLATNGGVHYFLLSPDGTRVVYSADQEEDEVYQLYSVSSSGGLVTRLNDDLVPGGDVGRSSFIISPDGARVVYAADQSTDGVWEIFSVPINGGSPVQLNGALVAGGDVSTRKISPDSSRVVYIADQQTAGLDELYSVPIAGGFGVRLSRSLPGDVIDFTISPDSSMVVYRKEYSSDVYDLFSVAISGGSSHQLNHQSGFGLGVELDYTISPDSGRALYRGDDYNEYVTQLFSIPILGGTRIRLNGDLTTGGWVEDFKINPIGDRVVYRADQYVDEWPTGHRVPIAGPHGSDELIWSQPHATSDSDYQIDPSSSYLIVCGDSVLADSIDRLWKVVLEGTPDPLGEELIPDSDFHPDGDVTSFILGDDGTVVYVADQIQDEKFELFAFHPPLFVDGFESGDLSAWSASTP